MPTASRGHVCHSHAHAEPWAWHPSCPRPPARGKTAVMTATPAQRAHARRVFRALTKLYPDARCALDHRTPLELLIATILSAQCTDARVNLVTPALFARYRDANAYATADLKELESYIQSTGF